LFVAHHLRKLGAHLVTALACLHVHNLAREGTALKRGVGWRKRAGGSGET
jgi:hypothetical protein